MGVEMIGQGMMMMGLFRPLIFVIVMGVGVV